MRTPFLLLFLFLFIDAQSQQIEVDLSYKYIFASNWDKAIQTYNFSRPFLSEKQPLFIHGINGSASYIFKSENRFKQGINASYSHFTSYAENVNFVNQYNLHFFNLGYMLRHESAGSLKGLCTDDDSRSKAFGIGADLSIKTSYSFNLKNNIRLSPFIQVGYTPYLYSPNTEAVMNQTTGLTAPEYTGVFTSQIGVKVRVRE